MRSPEVSRVSSGERVMDEVGSRGKKVFIF